MKRARSEEEKEERWVIVISHQQAMEGCDLNVVGVPESLLEDPKNDNPKWNWKAQGWDEPWVKIDDLSQFTQEHACTVRIKNN